MIPFSDSGSSRTRQAAAWNVRIDSGDLTDAERDELVNWMSQPGNAEEFSAQRQILDWTAELAAQQKARLRQRLPRRHLRSVRLLPDWFPRSLWAPAATCAVVAALACVAWLAGSGVLTRSYVTAIGEIRQVSLPDGSTTSLNTSTRLTWLGGVHRRHVRLLQGEALFEVKPDHAHPFQIELGTSRIIVVGTRFDVYEKTGGEVVVTVLQGVVRVQGTAPQGQWEERLTAHRELTYAPGGHRTVRVVDNTSATDWRDGIYRSEEDTLARVVSELSRYTRSKIIIADPGLTTLTVGGAFDIRDVPAALQRLVAAASDVPIVLTHAGDTYVLTRPPAPVSPAPRPGAPPASERAGR